MSAIEISVKEATVVALQKAIMDILCSHADTSTKELALKVLARGCRVDNTVIQHCQFGTLEGYHDDQRNAPE